MERDSVKNANELEDGKQYQFHISNRFANLENLDDVGDLYGG
jgi:hypothetical protein